MDVLAIQKIIAYHPCFAGLAPSELATLAHLVTEKSYLANEVLVREGEWVDSLYFIVSGSLLVRRKEEGLDVPLATLGMGEVVGLSESGFYSETGIRTATVMTLSEVCLLRLDLNAFYRLAETTPHIDAAMRQQASMMLRMNLIKRAKPFEKISFDKLRFLANQVEEVAFSPGQIIFKKGDPGDACYLIRAGRVEIFSKNEEGAEIQIAMLKAAAVFGESSLLLNAPRNADARAIGSVQLLKINRELLSDAMKEESHVAISLMRLSKARARPLRAANIEEHTHRNEEGEVVVTLKNTAFNTYYRLSSEGLFIWRQCDGFSTLRDLTLAFYNQTGVFEPSVISAFIYDLIEGGFISSDFYDRESSSSKKSMGRLLLTKCRQVLEAQWAFGSCDEWLTKTYARYAYIFFTKPAQIILMLISILGFFVFFSHFQANFHLLKTTREAGWLILLASVMGMACAIFHELAHAYTTKFYGRMVKSFGVGWYWFGPIAFCDTSDMWLSPNRERLRVDLAGLYCDLVMAGLIAMMALFFSNPTAILICWLLSLFLYLSVFTNLDPMIELDGYYALMDFSGVDNLRETSVEWLVKNAKHVIRNPRLLMRHKMMAGYALICLIFLILNLIVSYVVATLLLDGVLGLYHPAVSAFLALLVVFISTAGIISDIRK